MKPFIDPSFWSDPDIESKKAGVKLCALWFITNSQTSILGLCGASAARFKFETGLPSEAMENTIKALPRAFKRFDEIVFVRNYIRHQFGTGEKLMKNNFFVSLKSQFNSVKNEELRAFILSDYPEFEQGFPLGFTDKNNRSHTVSAGLRMRILNRDGFRCIITDELLDESELEIDHIIPRSRGGTTVPENLVAMGKVLNTLKNKKELEAFCIEQGFDFLTITERIKTRASKPLEGVLNPKDRIGKESTGGSKSVFSKPELAEVQAYGAEIGMDPADVESWYDHFQSNGWKVGGKSPMKDWKSALRNGKRNTKPKDVKTPPKSSKFATF